MTSSAKLLKLPNLIQSTFSVQVVILFLFLLIFDIISDYFDPGLNSAICHARKMTSCSPLETEET